MEFVVLLVVMFALNAISQAIQKNRGQGRGARTGRPRERVASRTGEAAGRKQPQSIKDLLDEFRRAMEEAERRSKGEDVVVLEPPTPVEEDYDEDLDAIEERESLEVVPEVRSLEAPVRVVERPVVDLDDEAEAAIRERLEWAERTARGRRPGDHAAFDERIRRKKPKVEEEPEAVRPDLRQAIIWREVLGPPVSLRDD
ncbi:MAG: hypothetical protein R2909_15515 [Gemmatimonadales bacterium]